MTGLTLMLGTLLLKQGKKYVIEMPFCKKIFKIVLYVYPMKHECPCVCYDIHRHDHIPCHSHGHDDGHSSLYRHCSVRDGSRNRDGISRRLCSDVGAWT